MIFNTHYSYFDEPCLTFSSASPFSITIPSTSTYEGSLYYSTDAFHWNLCTKGNMINSSSNGQLYMRGLGNNTFCGNNRSDAHVTTDSWIYSGNDYVDVIGNIENLLDYREVKNNNHPVMYLRCFCLLFYNWDKLRRAPTLPATTLVGHCYEGMFWNCTSLTAAPALPATTLAGWCYFYTFSGCTSLTTAPALSATALAQHCYEGMFTGCTSLTVAPALPATTLTTLDHFCYTYMFSGCTSLTAAPALPATTLTYQCYYGMFQSCTSLTAAPALPATNLKQGCYAYMFDNCTSLTTIPRLHATSIPDEAYGYMFRRCSKVKISETGTSDYNNTLYIGTASGTNSLKDMFTGTGGTFTGTPTENTTYYTSNSVI